MGGHKNQFIHYNRKNYMLVLSVLAPNGGNKNDSFCSRHILFVTTQKYSKKLLTYRMRIINALQNDET
jgi:hypothetical protein